MKRLSINDNPAGLTQALCSILQGSGTIALPTETVYGLAADATDAQAVANVYNAKGRPSFNPLIIHVSDIEMAERYAHLDERARTMVRAFWPGPLTLVLPRRDDTGLAPAVTSGLGSVAVRCPQGFMRELIAAYGKPLAAPSANRSGHVSATSAGAVIDDLQGRIDAVVDGGSCPGGIESTILSLVDKDVRLLRPGAIPVEALETVLGQAIPVPANMTAARPSAPGMLASHYAPGKPLRLNANHVELDEGLLYFGASACPSHNLPVYVLSEKGDLAEAASRLYEGLRWLDRKPIRVIAVSPVPADGLGAAINDRLSRAAAPKD